jgi:hypothetical protein
MNKLHSVEAGAAILALTARTLGYAKLHVTHSKDETGPCEWTMMSLRIKSNLFILNNMAERVGFENKVQRTFNNMQGQR